MSAPQSSWPKQVSKSHPGVQAVQTVVLEAYPGEVLAICGANGAGSRPSLGSRSVRSLPRRGIRITGHDGPIVNPYDLWVFGTERRP